MEQKQILGILWIIIGIILFLIVAAFKGSAPQNTTPTPTATITPTISATPSPSATITPTPSATPTPTIIPEEYMKNPACYFNDVCSANCLCEMRLPYCQSWTGYICRAGSVLGCACYGRNFEWNKNWTAQNSEIVQRILTYSQGVSYYVPLVRKCLNGTELFNLGYGFPEYWQHSKDYYSCNATGSVAGRSVSVRDCSDAVFCAHQNEKFLYGK